MSNQFDFCRELNEKSSIPFCFMYFYVCCAKHSIFCNFMHVVSFLLK